MTYKAMLKLGHYPELARVIAECCIDISAGLLRGTGAMNWNPGA
jgi:hypothetical protein